VAVEPRGQFLWMLRRCVNAQPTAANIPSHTLYNPDLQLLRALFPFLQLISCSFIVDDWSSVSSSSRSLVGRPYQHCKDERPFFSPSSWWSGTWGVSFSFDTAYNQDGYSPYQELATFPLFNFLPVNLSFRSPSRQLCFPISHLFLHIYNQCKYVIILSYFPPAPNFWGAQPKMFFLFGVTNNEKQLPSRANTSLWVRARRAAPQGLCLTAVGAMRQWRGHSHANAAHSREWGLVLSSLPSSQAGFDLANNWIK
jgi:hypothetical protein